MASTEQRVRRLPRTDLTLEERIDAWVIATLARMPETTDAQRHQVVRVLASARRATIVQSKPAIRRAA